MLPLERSHTCHIIALQMSVTYSFHNVTGKLMPTVVLEQQHTRIDEAERMTGSAWSKEARRSCTL